MERLHTRLRILFFFALGLSIGFPLGVLGIIFGAVYGKIFLLVVGILLAALGFYVMPILWVMYGDRRGDRTLLSIIETEHLYEVNALSLQTGYPPKDISRRILRLIHSRALVGFLFVGGTLVPNQKTAKKQTPESRTCESCGAPMQYREDHYFCEYCLRREAE